MSDTQPEQLTRKALEELAKEYDLKHVGVGTDDLRAAVEAYEATGAKAADDAAGDAELDETLDAALDAAEADATPEVSRPSHPAKEEADATINKDAQAEADAFLASGAAVNARRAPERSEEKVLVKMERKNLSWEFGRYRFTNQHPFQLLDRKDADVLFENLDGFRPATPKEADAFYS